MFWNVGNWTTYVCPACHAVSVLLLAEHFFAWENAQQKIENYHLEVIYGVKQGKNIHLITTIIERTIRVAHVAITKEKSG